MVDILHRVGVIAAPDKVYAALTTIDGVASWWTEDATGDAGTGGEIRFGFPPGSFDMKVLETQPDKRVVWEVIRGPKEWIGTHIRFELKQDDAFTIVLFSQQGWKEPAEFMSHCSTKMGDVFDESQTAGRDRPGRALAARRPDQQLALVALETKAAQLLRPSAGGVQCAGDVVDQVARRAVGDEPVADAPVGARLTGVRPLIVVLGALERDEGCDTSVTVRRRRPQLDLGVRTARQALLVGRQASASACARSRTASSRRWSSRWS